MNSLLREHAPIPAAAWKEIDDEAKRTLKLLLAARRLVDFQGPLGWEASANPTARTEKIRRFGQVVGATLSSDSADWERATEFVRDLEQLNDHDLAAMQLLWDMQHEQEAAPGRMHTDGNRYTGEWNRVIGFAASRLHWHSDELYSRCGRLAGFGLALEVQRNGSHQGPSDHCFRLTGKAVQLLRMLGVTPTGLPPADHEIRVFG